MDNPSPYPYFANHSKSQFMSQVSTDKLQLAAQFVNSTASHIFLTGKAGTGKTTFLHNLAEATHKKFVVVAPTGIAALNAKGVTIHSQFLLPFGTYLPEPVQFQGSLQSSFYTRKELASRHSLNSARKKVLRNIDLLIIDEVSMLRADLLDAIDYRMRAVKGDYKRPFGGVQLLMIGDLYQLPPIVKDHEWQYMKQFYRSPHFFEALALKEGFTYIELDKIFRQSDDTFINVLNNLRNDVCTPADLELLNSHFREGDIEEEGVITLTTHNNRADKMNREALDKLDGPSHYYEAEVEKDFPEKLFPLPESLELRVGAQVMFVKNDISESKAFYNGKIAQVTKLGDDSICVSMEGDDEYWLSRHEWENKKYQVNESTKDLEEEVIGTFSQFPIRLAWAITVHKSQGLTFDKAVIDVGQAFAPGQVYVALSRLRSLDGLILRTKISSSVISSDAQVVSFSTARAADDLNTRLQGERKRYLFEMLGNTFSFEPILKQLEYTQSKMAGKLDFEDEEMKSALNNLREAFAAEEDNTRKFRGQLAGLLHREETEKLKQRLIKGREYYLGFLKSRAKELLIHIGEVSQLSRTKAYVNLLEEIDQLIMVTITDLLKVSRLCECMLNDEEITQLDKVEAERKNLREDLQQATETHLKDNPKNLSTKSGRKSKAKKPKGETYKITYEMVKGGLTPDEIAAKREMAVSTIEGHLAKGITEGEIEVHEVIGASDLKEITAAFGNNIHQSLNDVFKGQEGKYTFGKLRIVQAYLRSTDE